MLRLRIAACAIAFALPAAATAAQLTVSAAASLTNAFKEIGQKFEAANPGDALRFNFAASGALLQQIDQGAPVDVFASADQATMDRAEARNLIDAGSRKDFAANSLVLVEPAAGGPGLQALQDLSGPAVRRVAVGKPASVPAGRYTRQALEAAGLWSAVEPKAIPADSVRQVLDYVSRGEVDAGFVYRTDAALMSDKVRIVLTATGHDPVTYPVAVVAASKEKAAAQKLIDFLAGDEAREILARYGFDQP